MKISISMEQRINNIEAHLTTQKSILTFKEAALFISLSESYLYKLTSKAGIPCYKPHGKHLYFKREELEQWLLSNRKATTEEIDALATNYVALRQKQGTSISATPKLQLNISSQQPV